VIAVILLLVPTNNANVSGQHQQTRTRYGHSANDEVIEGEFTEVHDHKPADNVVHLPRKD